MLGLQRLSKVSSVFHVQPKVLAVRRDIGSLKDDSLESTLEELGRLLRSTSSEPEEERIPIKKVPKKKSLEPKKMEIEDLKYLHLYPKVVQRLVLNAKSPYGYFSDTGAWVESRRSPERIEEDKKHEFNDVQLSFKPKPTHPKMEGVYRFGITEEEIKDCHPKIKEFFSMTNAPAKEVLGYKIRELASKFGKNEYDTGNVSVQSKISLRISSNFKVAVLSEKISHINTHMVLHHHDMVAKKNLIRMLVQRKAYMRYLKRKNVSAYFPLLKSLGLKDSYTI